MTSPTNSSPPPPPSTFFATAPRGVEELLAEELREIGVSQVVVRRGGVGFGRPLDQGGLEDGYRACLWSRIASRVLLPLTRYAAPDADSLYRGAAKVDWSKHLHPDRTFRVDVAGKNAPAGPPHFVALKIKDAIVDRIRDAAGRRPSVDTKQPDLRIHVHLAGDQVTLSIDLAGESLHRRGVRRKGAAAPLKENLAAAILRLSGWPERFDAPLYDPLCGSATLLIEAAWTALDAAPGLERRGFGAEGWNGHDRELWRSLIDEAHRRREAAEDRVLRIAGSDESSEALQAARANVRAAGLQDHILIQRRALADAEPPFDDAGLLITNPPYGERIGVAGELGPLYQLLGDVFKRRFPGWNTYVLTGNPALAKRIGLRPVKRHVLMNGPIECRLLDIPISEKKVEGDYGPGWRKPSADADAFASRLLKNLKKLQPWARQKNLTCYRVYDTDISIFNLSVDWYDGAVRVEEYARPKKVRPAVADQRLTDVLSVIPEVFGIESDQVHLRVRAKRRDGEQHERRGEGGAEREVCEGELRFLVNLEDYLDTGLFLDDRELRKRIRKAGAKSFLNLFSYTCAASVAAAAGGAKTTSVDLSNTYLDWGRRNFELNDLDPSEHEFLRKDAVKWLQGDRVWGRSSAGSNRQTYDLIFIAPPTSSRSKAMDGDFDVQRDHRRILRQAAELLTPDGEILFASNLRDFELDESLEEHLKIQEITQSVTPRDFVRRPRLRAWSLRR